MWHRLRHVVMLPIGLVMTPVFAYFAWTVLHDAVEAAGNQPLRLIFGVVMVMVTMLSAWGTWYHLAHLLQVGRYRERPPS